MEFIAHRINTKDELAEIPHDYGVEVDIRDHGSRLVMQHDPFLGGEDFENYLTNYQHGTLILNIKSERVELKVLELLRKFEIERYFFLDSSFPMVRQLVQSGEKRIALRYSEFESIETILNLKSDVEWVWVDSFKYLSLTQVDYKRLKDAGFKLCLVSPELQKRESEIPLYKQYCIENEIVFDAVCTKMHHVEKWKI